MSIATAEAGGTVPQLLVGAAKRDVTPSRLANLDPRGGAFTGVHDPLHVRAVVVEDKSTVLAIVSIDAIEVGDTRALAERVEEEVGIPGAHLFITGTHTHSAPRVGRVSPGALALASRPEFDAFTVDVADAVIDVLRAALARRRSATVAFGAGSVDVNVNRDLLVDGVWRSERNDAGPSDKTLTVVRLADHEGLPIAVLLSYAVHSTVTFGTGEVSADLAGAAASHLERTLGHEAIAVWLPGALGDQDPRLRFGDAGTGADATRFAYDALAAQALLIGAEAERVVSRARLCSGSPDLAVLRKSFVLPAQAGHDDRDDVTFAGASTVRLPIGVVLLHDIALCTAGGEVVTEVAAAIRRRSPLTRTVVVSLTDDRIGYLTTDEAYGRPTFESLRSPVQRGHAERTLVDGFADLVRAGLTARMSDQDRPRGRTMERTTAEGDGPLDSAARDTPLSFLPPRSDDDGIMRPTEPTPTHDLIVRLTIEGATTVVIEPQGAASIPLRDAGGGRYEGTVPFLEQGTGPRPVEVVVDGVRTIAPELPILWTGGRPRNVVEMPDPDSADWSIRRVPHGAMTREVYWSESMQDHCRCIVYTPPGSATGIAPYPVLYLLHGFTDNETAWEHQGRLAYILDNLIADGLIRPVVVVLNNGMVRRRRYEGSIVDDLFEQVLIEDCIPFVEGHHRVLTDRLSRGVAGLSMGSYMANDIGLGNPDLFAHVGQFTASMTHETMLMTYPRPYTTLDGTRDLPGEYTTFFRSTTPAEDHFDYFEADDRICVDTGLAALPGYHRIVYPAGTSKWRSWRLGLRDFLQAAFPPAT